MSELAEKIEASGTMESVIARPKARVPVVVLVDKATQLHCDITMSNRLALLNSQLVRCYMALDERAPQLCFLVKFWAKKRGVNDPYRGSPSSYAYVLLVIQVHNTFSR